MKAFAELYAQLDATTSNNAKLAAMQAYFQHAAPADAAWAVFFLSGGKPRQLVPSKILRLFGTQAAGISDWLFEESYHSVGDLAETLSLLIPPGAGADDMGLADWMQLRLLPLRGLPPDDLIEKLAQFFDVLNTRERFVLGKLVTGSLRVGVSKLLVTRALAQVSGQDPKLIAQRLMGYTDLAARPDAAGFQALIAPASEADNARADGRPYPFFLAHPLQISLEQFDAQLGKPQDWVVEWKWDGIRAQLVKRGGRSWLWSRGEELITDRFPEIAKMGEQLPDGVVLDGEILVWEADQVQSFARLQQRLGRKTVGPKILAAQPVVFLAYDVLEIDGADYRAEAQHIRRSTLERLSAQTPDPILRVSPEIVADDWAALSEVREEARDRGVEGMMLKSRGAAYGVGRTKNEGLWWKWKVDPFSIDAVLLYAQRGSGRRASLYSDYTFAVWDGPDSVSDRKLVPVAKAYSGLTDAEMRRVDAIVRRSTIEKFGPVRSVKPALVFELGFEGIARSTRHKSGVALRFPRMLRWREDKTIAEADTLGTLMGLLPS